MGQAPDDPVIPGGLERRYGIEGGLCRFEAAMSDDAVAAGQKLHAYSK